MTTSKSKRGAKVVAVFFTDGRFETFGSVKAFCDRNPDHKYSTVMANLDGKIGKAGEYSRLDVEWMHVRNLITSSMKAKTTKKNGSPYNFSWPEFIDVFNEAKEAGTGKRGIHKAMSPKDHGNFKRIAKAYTLEDCRMAAKAMFQNDWLMDVDDPKKHLWTPSHLLRVKVFERYLNEWSSAASGSSTNEGFQLT